MWISVKDVSFNANLVQIKTHKKMPRDICFLGAEITIINSTLHVNPGGRDQSSLFLKIIYFSESFLLNWKRISIHYLLSNKLDLS